MEKDLTPHSTERDRDVGTHRYHQHIGVPLRRAVVGFIVFYVLAGLLNGENILRQAEQMPYSQYQVVCVILAKPLARLSQATGFNQPRLWLNNWRKGG